MNVFVFETGEKFPRRSAPEREWKKREEERERLRHEQAQRDALLQEIHRRFDSDFLSADSFFQESCAGLIPQWTYEQKKISFVKSWVENNTSSSVTKGEQPDDEQAAAIASVNGHVKVIARAGSGKTTTLVNRALFLLKHCGVGAGEMLLLAFNRKAALEMKKRLLVLLYEGTESVAADIARRMREVGRGKKINDVDTVAREFNITLPHVMTFHALAGAIVRPEESLLYNDPEGEDQKLSRVVQQIIDKQLQTPNFEKEIRELMLAYFREDWERIVEGDCDQSKEEFLRFRRSLPSESLDGKYVKSYGEKIIANFLFEHDIPYKYECNHWSYFTIPDSGVIIKCFGLKGEADYDEMSDDKRKYWGTKKDWTLIEFISDDITRNGLDSFFALLKSRLEEQGIRCTRLSEDEIWRLVRGQTIGRFTKATVSFIGRCRQLSLSPEKLRERISSYSSLSDVEEMFLNLAHRLYGAYLERLSATEEEDFNGLMQRAAEAIDTGRTSFQRKSGSGNLTELRYVCIDEFQDFSELFYRLLDAIRKQNPQIELFCVGDDWQAINGFAGSDLRFFKNFEEYIGESRSLDIRTNYRSSNEIIDVGNALMDGLGKPAIAHKKSSGKVLVSDLNDFKPSLVETHRHPGDNITPAVLRLVNKGLADDLDVVMLCRRNTLPWFVNYSDQVGGNDRSLNRFLDLIQSFFPDMKERISISTVHKYKGLEKSMVIVLDAVARNYPLIHPYWVFSSILGESLGRIAEEERRLLYVALTRAIETLVVITDGRNKSPFLEDLERGRPLSAIKWTDFPPGPGSTPLLVVKVGNQENRRSAPTYAIMELLKSSGYRWAPTGWHGWRKSFPAEGFSLETIKAEVWACATDRLDGVEIRVFDHTETLLAARYLLNKGKWHCLSNKLDALCASKAELPNRECEPIEVTSRESFVQR